MFTVALVLAAVTVQEHPWESRLRAVEAVVATNNQKLAANDAWAVDATDKLTTAFATMNQGADAVEERIAEMEKEVAKLREESGGVLERVADNPRTPDLLQKLFDPNVTLDALTAAILGWLLFYARKRTMVAVSGSPNSGGLPSRPPS